jgi:hypothetical protein
MMTGGGKPKKLDNKNVIQGNTQNAYKCMEYYYQMNTLNRSKGKVVA